MFVFPGQGSQWAGMAAGLLETSPVFAAAVSRCEEALAPWTDWSLTAVVRGDAQAPPLEAADVVQPALFSVMVALAELWRSVGVTPDAVVGHSLGEVAAAHVAGALDLDDAARVVALWSKAQATLAGAGEMVSVLLPEEEVRERLAPWEGRLTVAAVNSPGAVIVSGDSDAAAEMLARFTEDGVQARRIEVGLAAHSPHIDAILPTLREALAPIRPAAPTVPLYSSLVGGLLDGEPMDADYWCRSLRSTVRFRQAVAAAVAEGHRIAVEISPHPVLTAAVQNTAEHDGQQLVVQETVRRGAGTPERFVRSLAELYVRGAEPDWTALRAHEAPAWEGAARLAEVVGEAGERWEAGPAEGSGVPEEGEAARLRALPAAERRRRLLDLVRTQAAAAAGQPDAAALDERRPFKELGFDSVMAVGLRNGLRAALGLALPTTLVFDHPTAGAVAAHLDTLVAGEPAGGVAQEEPAAGPRAADPDDPVVIVGMGCRYPGGAEGPEELWRLVREETDAVTAFPADRGWDTEGAYDAHGRGAGRYYQREAGFLASAAQFDAGFFGISPREALAMDPQQRLLLETSWEALERAGIDPASLRGSRTGVFVGAMTMDYGPRAFEAGEETGGYVLTGTTGSVASGRVAYTLGLEGPAVTVDTACSSSLVALHQACQALRQGECELALAGGATVMPSLSMFVEFSRQGGLSADGRCKAFADGADGFGLAEGAGVLVVERLTRARRLGHRVWAVVRGSAVNQDGASNGLTAPSGPSQQRVIRQAWASAGVTGADVDVVEAHGTGTRLGDPIEAQALLATYGRGRDPERPLWLGSLKSNIGHTQAAAGVGGVIKSVLAMRHGTLPRTLHVDAPTSEVDWSQGTVRLLTDRQPWPREGDRPRRAAVSSFGVSGTNAHMILEEYPEEPAPADGETVPAAAGQAGREPVTAVAGGALVPWPLSGATEAALRAQAQRLHACLASKNTYRLPDVGYALATTRSVFAHRAVVLARDTGEAMAGLADLAAGEPSGRALTGSVERPGKTVFVFPGQGSQWRGMATQLLAQSPVFAARMDECADALAEFTDWSLLEVLHETEGSPSLDRVDVVQPALFAVMVSLAALWRSHGVEPDAVVGHSQGEIAAACVAGALGLRDAARVVTLRSQAIRDVLAGHGGMMSVALPQRELAGELERCQGRVSLAAVNGPSSAVVSGEAAALDALQARCESRQVRVRRVPVDYASHSVQVEAIRDRLLRDLDGLTPTTPHIPFHSTVHGLASPDAGGTGPLDAAYWYENLRRTVDFADTVRALADDGHTLFVEASSHPVLVPGMRETFESLDIAATALGSLRRDEGGLSRFVTSLAAAHTAGASPDWEAVFEGTGAHRVELPTYAFQRRRYWQEPTRAAGLVAAGDRPEDDFWSAVEAGDDGVLERVVGARAAEGLRRVLPELAEWRRTARTRAVIDSWRYRVTWKPFTPAEQPGLAGRWLVVVPRQAGDESADVLEEALAGAGASPVRVTVPGGETDRARIAELVGAAAGEQPVAGVLALPYAGQPTAEGPLPAGTALALALVQALGDALPDSPLWLLTRGAVGAAEQDGAADPDQAQLWGMGRVLGLEHPERWGGLVDLPGAPEKRTAARLAALLAGAGDEDQIALRASGTFVRRLSRARLGSATAPRSWRPHGTVLVTGGTGALGGHVAEWLAGNGAEHVVLTSRRGPQAPGAAELEARLTALGAKVTVRACDVADPDQTATLLADVEETAGPVRAVFHTAGVLHTTDLDEVSAEEFADLLAGKVTGARNLDRLLDTPRVEAFVLFSSNGGVWGSRGQGAYAAANASLDALAEQRRASGLAATSVAWGLWGGGDTMADPETERYLRRHGLRPMAPRAAIDALTLTLDHDETFVSVADVDWASFAPGFTAARPRPLIADLPEVRNALREAAGTDDDAEEAGAPLVRELAGLPAAEQVNQLLNLVVRQAASVLGHEATDGIRRTGSFRELGFDSLTAVELRNRLAAACGTRMPATLVFDHPNPAALAAHLRERLLPEQEHGAPVPAPGPDSAEHSRAHDALTRIPAARLRASGLLDALLDLAGADEEPGEEEAADSAAEERIEELDDEALLRMALGEGTEESR
ncbi:SDR family NAD(P)-dependent oxidoreductase [Streptomyces reniochalinae]|uniref:SDR family NAD(P)-dependent oxidoreductase n=2 Tax=Streptomyces reniochalinae TaxID=2250578 RepID=A0A367ED21_9ACTN|nr:SDR family NAD(P)-dependent oxidoreductase [Streptomyces reniochalinae]